MIVQNNFILPKKNNQKSNIEFKALRWDENTRRLGDVVKKNGEDFFDRHKEMLYFNNLFSKEQCEQLKNILVKKGFNVDLTAGKNSYVLYDSKRLLINEEETKTIKKKLNDIETDCISEYERLEQEGNKYGEDSKLFDNLRLKTVEKHKLLDTVKEIFEGTKIFTTEAVDNILDKSIKTSEWVQKQLTMIQEKVQNTNNEIIKEVL